MKNKKPKITLYTGGTPIQPGKFRVLTDEEAQRFKERFEELKREGKILHSETRTSVTEHEYLDYQIQINEELENYELCAELLKQKNETPYSEEKTHTIVETF